MSELNLTHSNGNKVKLTTPDTLAASKTFKLPGADGSSGQVLTTNGSGALSFSSVSGLVLAMGYSSDGSDSNTTVNNTTTFAGSTLAMTRVSATSKYILRIGAQIYRPNTSGRGYLRYQVKVNSGSYNTTPGDSSRYEWYVGCLLYTSPSPRDRQ